MVALFFCPKCPKTKTPKGATIGLSPHESQVTSMNPVESPAPARPAHHKLKILPVLQPKRRCKTRLESVPPRPKEPEFVPFHVPAHRPERMTRSGQPFQVWKAPASERPPLQKETPRPEVSQTTHTLWELARSYGRTLALLFSGRWLHHSP